jgi:hypothetical protein
VRSFIVTEGGKFEEWLVAAFVKEMLPDLKVRVVAAGGRSNASSLASSVLLETREPVALVLNAHTVDPDLLRIQRQESEMLLDLAAHSSLWTVALFEPEIERCFFRRIDFVEELLGAKLTERQAALIEYDPKRILKEIAPDYRELLPQLLAGKSLAPLKEDPALRQVVDFLEEVHRRAAA